MIFNSLVEKRTIQFSTLHLLNNTSLREGVWTIVYLACRLHEAMATPTLQAVV